ncbi:MAG: SDR family oxidoreductase [Thermoguttaceae bacterium]|nr:SDR family oxidoreductase [Thermoguttaceae bacterium]
MQTAQKNGDARKYVVISGASGGIGRAVAESYRGENVALYLQTNRNRSALTDWARRNGGDFASVEIFEANLATESGVGGFVDDVLGALRAAQQTDVPRLDAFVAAAGVDLMTPEMKAATFDERLRRVWAVDVAATVATARAFGAAARAFRRKSAAESDGENRVSLGNLAASGVSPALVLFGWDGVDRGMEGETAQLYAICKGAVVSFGRSLAQELAPEVRVNVVSPGWIRTTWGAVASEAATKRVAAESLSGRWGTAAEVAAVVRFLTSDAAAYLNGQNVPVNGGFSFRRRVDSNG